MNAAMVSGMGQYHTNEFDPKNLSKKLKAYNTITLSQIRQLVDTPQQVEKKYAQWFIPSTWPSRNFRSQEDNGEFWMLWADLDKNPTAIEQVAGVLHGQIIQGTDFEIYSSRSSSEHNQKARILIPLAQSLNGKDWVLVQEVLNDKLDAIGITPDRASEGAAQLCYLPNRGEYYKSQHQREHILFDPLKRWSVEIEKKRHEVKELDKEIKSAQKAVSDKNRPMASSSTKNIFEAFNESYTPEDFMLSAGYDRCGNKFRHPGSQSGSFSASIQHDVKGNLRVHSLSSSDPLYTGDSGGGAHDAFSTFCVLKHGGDRNAAIKDAGDNWITVNGVAWNKAKQDEHKQSRDENKAIASEPALMSDAAPGKDEVSQESKPEGNHQFKLISIKELIDNPKPIQWVVKDVIEKGGMNLVAGAYGSGKTFVAVDLAFCIAGNLNWHGKKVQQMPVIFLAGEGHSGVGNRFAALEIEYGIKCPDALYISTVAANLTDASDVELVGKIIDQHCNGGEGTVFIDTLNRNFGGADENSTRDMTTFIHNVDKVFRNTGKTVVIIHHTGHADDGRSRGSSALPGACEGEFIVSKMQDGLTLKTKKQKNAQALPPLKFKFKNVPLPARFNLESDEAVSSVVLKCEGEADTNKPTARLNAREDLVLSALSTCLANSGVLPDARLQQQFGGGDGNQVSAKKVVHIDYWRKASYPILDADGDIKADSKQKAFKRIRDKLFNCGKVRNFEDYWWIVYE